MIDAILDTIIVIDLLRGDIRAVSWYSGLGQQHIAITPVVWLETVQGAPNKAKRDIILQYLRRFTIEHPTADDNYWAMRQFAQYRLSHNVDFPDVMIASVAVRLNIPLYILNIKHYAPLPNVNEIRPY